MVGETTQQRQDLLELGIAEERIYTDHGLTGTTRARPGLDQALAAVREGDTLVVPKLDRLARSVPDARAIADQLQERPEFSGQIELAKKGRLLRKVCQPQTISLRQEICLPHHRPSPDVPAQVRHGICPVDRSAQPHPAARGRITLGPTRANKSYNPTYQPGTSPTG